MYAHNNNSSEARICNSTHYKPTSTLDYIAYEDIEQVALGPSMESQINQGRFDAILKSSEDSATCWPDAILPPNTTPNERDENQFPPPYVVTNENNRLSYEVVDRERRPTECEIIALPSHTPIVAFCPHCQTSVQVYAKESSSFSQKLTTALRKLFHSHRVISSSVPIDFSRTKYLCKICVMRRKHKFCK